MCRLKKHAYAELPTSEKHASKGKNVRTNTRNSAFPRALFDFRNKLEIAISDIPVLILPVCVPKVKPKVNKKSGETRSGFIAYLLSDGYPIQKLYIPNLKFEIPN